MKKIVVVRIFSCFILMCGSIVLKAQNIGINETGAVANSSAILDVVSANKGVLVPRMTSVQRNAIPNPATGLLIYQTDNIPGFYYYNSVAWVSLQDDYDWSSDVGNDISHYGGVVRIKGEVPIVGIQPGDTALVVTSNSLHPTVKFSHYNTGQSGKPALIVQSDDGAYSLEAYSGYFGKGAIYAHGGAVFSGGQLTVDTGTVDINYGNITMNGYIDLDSSDVSSAGAGSIRWNNTDFLGYDGATWKSLTTTSSPWTTTGSDIYRNTGSVGIGLTIPSSSYKLDVEGDVRLSPASANADFIVSHFGSEPSFLPSLNNYGYIGNNLNRIYEGHYTNLTVYGSFTNTSDRRIKENIQPLNGALNKVLQLSGKTYDFKKSYMFGDGEYDAEKTAVLEASRKNKIGFIAQEIEEVLPQLVKTNASTDLKSVDYIGVIPLLVEAIKEQNELIKELQLKVSQLNSNK